MLDTFENGMPDFAPESRCESPGPKIEEWTLADAAQIAVTEPTTGTGDYEWHSEGHEVLSPTAPNDRQDAYNEMVFMLQLEQMQIVSSMDQFMHTMQEHMQKHQRRVERHHSKQLELLRGIGGVATCAGAVEGWPTVPPTFKAEPARRSIDSVEHVSTPASPKTPYWYNVVTPASAPDRKHRSTLSSKNSVCVKDTVHRAYETARSVTLNQKHGEAAVLMTLEKTGLDKSGHKSRG